MTANESLEATAATLFVLCGWARFAAPRLRRRVVVSGCASVSRWGFVTNP